MKEERLSIQISWNAPQIGISSNVEMIKEMYLFRKRNSFTSQNLKNGLVRE